MEKIYGYKEKDILELAKMIKEKGNRSLSSVFESFSRRTGKAKGTVRNMYYALAKASRENQDLCESVLDGKPLAVGKIVEFDKDAERDLLKKVLCAKKEGKSARSAIIELSGGDMKLALRLQNKFRNTIKFNTQLVNEIVGEINEESGNFSIQQKLQSPKSHVSDLQLKRLKKEIDGLVEKISLKARKENAYLKERVSALELENLRLSNLLYSSSRAQSGLNSAVYGLGLLDGKKGRNLPS